jgi:hypothetical protein
LKCSSLTNKFIVFFITNSIPIYIFITFWSGIFREFKWWSVRLLLQLTRNYSSTRGEYKRNFFCNISVDYLLKLIINCKNQFFREILFI